MVQNGDVSGGPGPGAANGPHPSRLGLRCACPKPSIVCAPGPPGGALSFASPCRWAARWPFLRTCRPPAGAQSRAALLVALAGLRPSAARRARPPLRGPAPAHCARWRGRASLAVPPACPGCAPRPCAPFVPPWAFGGPPGGVRAGGLFPPALFRGLVVVLVRRSGGPSAGPLARLRARGAPGPAPRRGRGPRCFRGGAGPFFGVLPWCFLAVVCFLCALAGSGLSAVCLGASVGRARRPCGRQRYSEGAQCWSTF